MTFLWGAATSSHQIEGYNESNDWWAWESQGKIEGGVHSGAATDHWNRFREDIGLAADLGLNSYRFSVEWSRFEPKEGIWDSSAAEWYSALIAECRRHGIVPMITLHHFTLPHWIAQHGGFTWSETPERFARFTRKIARALGSNVHHWCTVNEPMVLAIGSYLGRFMPPGEFCPEKFTQACGGLLRSHVLAYDALHAELGSGIEVGTAHNMIDFHPDRIWHPIENAIRWAVDRFYNQAWLDAVTGRAQNFGIPGVLRNDVEVAEARHRATVDFIGVNYYTKGYIQWKPRDLSSAVSQDLPIGIAFSRRKEACSDLGWAVHPTGFRKVLSRAARYGLPIYVTENGIADDSDRLRPGYLASHLREIAIARRRGADIRGYYHWSLLDNFEWIKGFKPRFGLYRVNYETYDRNETRSARLLRKLIQAHRTAGLDAPVEELLP